MRNPSGAIANTSLPDRRQHPLVRRSPNPPRPQRIREPLAIAPRHRGPGVRSLAGRRRDGWFFGRCRRSLGAVPRTYGVVRGGGRGCAWRWHGGRLSKNRQIQHKKGVFASHQRTSIHVPAYVVRRKRNEGMRE